MSNEKRRNRIAELHDAAVAIVEAARDGLRSAGEPHPESRQIHIPVVIAGSDLRIVVESGPGTAAANALVGASMRAGGKPGLPFDDAVRRAMDLLAADAASLRETHTRGPGHDDWSGEAEAKERHDELVAVVTALQRGMR